MAASGTPRVRSITTHAGEKKMAKRRRKSKARRNPTARSNPSTGLRRLKSGTYMLDGKFISQAKASSLLGSGSKPKSSRSRPKAKRAKAKSWKARGFVGAVGLPDRKKRKSTYAVRPLAKRSKKGHKRYSLVRQNSLMTSLTTAVKSGAIIYAALLVGRVATGLIKDHVVGTVGKSGLLKSASSTGFLAKLAPYTASIVGLAVAALAPRFIKRQDTLKTVQMGAVLLAADNLVQALVVPKLTRDSSGNAIVADSTGKLPIGATVGKYLGLSDVG
jgi:hypothetical protein